jgi:hypothetical protein
LYSGVGMSAALRYQYYVVGVLSGKILKTHWTFPVGFSPSDAIIDGVLYEYADRDQRRAQ